MSVFACLLRAIYLCSSAFFGEELSVDEGVLGDLDVEHRDAHEGDHSDEEDTEPRAESVLLCGGDLSSLQIIDRNVSKTNSIVFSYNSDVCEDSSGHEQVGLLA